ncbi:MAG TPA: hypothetical protein VF297_13265 [Pyrinomonadaceae bacterium]
MPAQNRVPVFELHIRPMLRLLDRYHMLDAFDLWDLKTVWKKRDSILKRVKGLGPLMPPARYGGPWPAEWIALFERWIATGDDNKVGHSLEMSAPDDGLYTIRREVGDELRLTADITLPTDGYRAWFDLSAVADGVRYYTLYVEPPYPRPEEPDETTITALEKFIKGTEHKIIIEDKNGTHEYPLP